MTTPASPSDAPLDTLQLAGHRFHLTRAVLEDVPALVALLADDVLGRDRESGDLAPYERAFALVDRDPDQLLLAVREDPDDGSDGDVVATLQLTLMPSLSRGGTLRLQIEAVRVAASTRGTGLGTALLEWSHEWGRARGATLAQLTTDRARADAHRFYERLGYTASHLGLKLPL